MWGQIANGISEEKEPPADQPSERLGHSVRHRRQYLRARSRAAKTLFWSTVQEAAILGEHLTGTGCRSAYERVSHLLLELLVR
jgi:hypothetical protein